MISNVYNYGHLGPFSLCWKIIKNTNTKMNYSITYIDEKDIYKLLINNTIILIICDTFI